MPEVNWCFPVGTFTAKAGEGYAFWGIERIDQLADRQNPAYHAG